jgi:hypothetical protein
MKWFSLIVLTLRAVAIMAQQRPLPSETALMIGWNRGLNQEIYKSGTVALERTLMRHASMQFGIGINCLSRPKKPNHTKFDTQVFTELRYYLLLQRGHALSGIYFGFFVGANRERWFYRDPHQTAIRRTFADFCPTIGYQHAIGKYIRFNQGIAAGHRTATRELQFAPNGDLDYDGISYYTWFSASVYVKIGVVF